MFQSKFGVFNSTCALWVEAIFGFRVTGEMREQSRLFHLDTYFLKKVYFRSRDDLHCLFTQLLLGDVIAADYLLAHLMSQIYLRKDGLNLGKFSLNIFGVPNSNNFAKRLSTILQLIMSKSHFLPLTTDKLNSLTFVPKKDYASNRLVSGLLQLSNGTHLVLDETAMRDGQLNQQGITNLTSLGQMIKLQSVEYDFGFHKLPFETDIPCLIFSEGRSMLPQDVQVCSEKNS